MPLTKRRNGEEVVLSAEEAAEIEARWAANNNPVTVLARAREQAEPLSFADLCEKLVQSGNLTVADAKLWANGAVPAGAVTAIEGLTGVKNQVQAYREAKTDSEFQRNSIFISALATALNLTDEQVDTVFGIT